MVGGAQQNRSTPSPFDFGLWTWTWTWIVTICLASYDKRFLRNGTFSMIYDSNPLKYLISISLSINMDFLLV